MPLFTSRTLSDSLHSVALELEGLWDWVCVCACILCLLSLADSRGELSARVSRHAWLGRVGEAWSGSDCRHSLCFKLRPLLLLGWDSRAIYIIIRSFVLLSQFQRRKNKHQLVHYPRGAEPQAKNEGGVFGKRGSNALAEQLPLPVSLKTIFILAAWSII